MQTLRRTIIAGLVMALVAAPALSHEHATGVVKERMELMEGMAKRMKAINARMKDKRDLAAIKADALALAADAPHIVHLFPPGSTQHPTEAKDTIWQNWSDFERLARALETESAKLAAANVGDVDALTAQVRVVSQTCGDCHEKYRVKK